MSEFTVKTRVIHTAGPFNIARLRNIAVTASSTPWILVTDPDFFTTTTFLSRITQFAQDAIFSKITPFLTFPVYHANQESTKILEDTASPQQFDIALSKFFVKSSYTKISDNCEFIAPYSNTIFTTKKIFEITGGYNECFKGYGSEDFEFMIRALLCFDIQPLPSNIFHDINKPTRDEFYKKNKRYAGFRRYLESYSFPVEVAGFRFVHLWHPRGGTTWHTTRDRNRKTLRSELSPILADPSLILEKDWLPRTQGALAVLTNRANWRFFLPLRCHGYRIFRLILNDSHDAQAIIKSARDMGAELIAFSDDALFHPQTANIVQNVKNLWPNTAIMSRDDMEKIHVYPLNMDDKNYISARVGPTRQSFISSMSKEIISYVINKFYDIKYSSS